jgi:glycerol-3-phosphate dehydrogenase
LRGGVVYHDGQFDDSRMAITLMQSAHDHGAICINYMKVTSLIKNDSGKICGAALEDTLEGGTYEVNVKGVVNATGVYVDDIMQMDKPESRKKVRPSQGVHIVVDAAFLGGNSALMIPKTRDGRVLFGVPWHGKAVLGTTDTPLNENSLEPKPLDEEIDFILDQAGQYLTRKPKRSDVLSVFAGLRPLAAPTHSDSKKTKEISRNHKIYVSDSGMLTITGGKWTTYRQMAEEAVNKVAALIGLEPRACVTRKMQLHGYREEVDRSVWDYVYGSDADQIAALIENDASLGELLHIGYTFRVAHVIWAVREEMAQTVEDVLARRVRALFMDARAAMEMAPRVAAIMAREMGKDKNWETEQVKNFTNLAKNYILA